MSNDEKLIKIMSYPFNTVTNITIDNNATVKDFLESYGHGAKSMFIDKISNMQRIPGDDPVVHYIGGHIGELIAITDEYIRYRLIIPPTGNIPKLLIDENKLVKCRQNAIQMLRDRGCDIDKNLENLEFDDMIPLPRGNVIYGKRNKAVYMFFNDITDTVFTSRNYTNLKSKMLEYMNSAINHYNRYKSSDREPFPHEDLTSNVFTNKEILTQFADTFELVIAYNNVSGKAPIDLYNKGILFYQTIPLQILTYICVAHTYQPNYKLLLKNNENHRKEIVSVLKINGKELSHDIKFSEFDEGTSFIIV